MSHVNAGKRFSLLATRKWHQHCKKNKQTNKKNCPAYFNQRFLKQWASGLHHLCSTLAETALTANLRFVLFNFNLELVVRLYSAGHMYLTLILNRCV